MVEINFDRHRPPALLDLTRVPELTEWELRRRPAAHRRRRDLRTGSSTSWATGCRAWPWRPARSARRRSATAAPSAATWARPRRPATPPVAAGLRRRGRARVGRRHAGVIPAREFFTGPKRNAMRTGRADRRRLVAARRRDRSSSAKVGTRNAMVIAVCSFARRARRQSGAGRRHRDRLGGADAGARPAEAEAFLGRRAGRGRAVGERGRGSTESRWPGSASWSRPRRSPIDDVRGTAAYRRHALAVMARRSFAWAWSEYR